MKRRLTAIVLILTLLFGGALSETTESTPPDPDAVAYGAITLMQALLMCKSAESFEEAPSPKLASEAILAYRILSGNEDASDEEIYALMFQNGEFTKFNEVGDPCLTPVEIEIDSAIDNGSGQIKVSLTVYADEGNSYEFYCLADIYLIPDSESPQGARISRLFFPE